MDRMNALRDKARALPLTPGVYIMKDAREEVIYVGKSKALKNRVSQYFQAMAAHTPKTVKMVAHVHDFDIIATGTEFEALVLENSLIKRHRPKYNILLKDDKGYPYIRFSVREDYPSFSIVSKPAKDGARYFGPYSGRGAAWRAITALRESLGLPACGKQFPRDIGKERPCLNHHLGKCIAPCSGHISSAEFMELCHQAEYLLEGRYQPLEKALEQQMDYAAENLLFERAAQLRDQLRAVRRLGEKQTVTSGGFADTDVVAFAAGLVKSCVVVLHYIGGVLLDKEMVLFDGLTEADAPEALEDYLVQYYRQRQVVPPEVLISAPVEGEEPLARWLSELAGRKVRLYMPQRGEKRKLVMLGIENARTEILRHETKEEKESKLLALIGQVLGLSAAPERIEAFDISNTSGDEGVAGMVVFEKGNPKPSCYRRFKIRETAGQNDVGSMAEAVRRRLDEFKARNEKFLPLPDVLLVDGGTGQVAAALSAMEKTGVFLPVFGMVKDDRHRTRALVDAKGNEIGITASPAIYAFFGKIQEEVHRYAIAYHRARREKRGYDSALDRIEGVGETRKRALLRAFKTIENIRNADTEALAKIVSRPVAERIKKELSFGGHK